VLKVAAAVFVVSFIASVAYTKADRTAESGFTAEHAESAKLSDVNRASAVSAVPAVSRSGAGEWRTVRMRVTGYCPCSKCCGDSADGITANGHVIQRGDTFVAADRRYAFGTEMIIPGYSNSQVVKVLDRGGAIRGDKLDAFFHTHQAALEWGVKYLDVQIRVN